MRKITKLKLEKTIYTEADFETMDWEDVPVYGFGWDLISASFGTDLLIDIDYTFKRERPNIIDEYFWVAPATLVFKDTSNLDVRIRRYRSTEFEPDIISIHRLNEVPSEKGDAFWKWHIELKNGDIYFESSGYEQIIKGEPLYIEYRFIPPEDRGETNFSREPY